MDPFVFDQRFARYMRQVDRAAINRGTQLYEAGHARVDAVGSRQIEGSVEERREGVFRVTLAANDVGGLSGSCSCPEVFNCAHSYALARAARERIVGPASARGGSNVPGGRQGSAESAFGRRLGRSLRVEEERLAKQIERAFKRAQSSGNLLYPKDLYEIAGGRRAFARLSDEPLRDLKRILNEAAPADEQAFADQLRGYFEYKGFAVSETLRNLATAPAPAKQERMRPLAAPAQAQGWDRPPLKLGCRLELRPASERDWFQVTPRLEVVGGGFSVEETRQLIAADGALVQLGEKGWFRLSLALGDRDAATLRTLGLDPLRGNVQRVHLCQVEELIPQEMVGEIDWRDISARARALRWRPPAEVPQRLQGVLRSYQVDGYRFLCRLSELGLGGILADDMGLGKTLQTLAWFLWKQEQLPIGRKLRVLVVCPKSVCDNWVQEPDKFHTGLLAVAFRSGLSGDDALAQANIVVANYAQLRLNADVFLGEHWDAVVLDEAQYIKSPLSQTTKVAYQLKGESKLALSGTPVENRLQDLWSLMRFAMPRLLGPLASFRANYESGNAPESTIELKKRIRPFLLRRLKGEVAQELPERLEEDIHCALEGRQRALYESELESARAALKQARSVGGGSSRLNVLQALLRLRQVCCDPRLLGVGGEQEQEQEGEQEEEQEQEQEGEQEQEQEGEQEQEQEEEQEQEQEGEAGSAKLQALLDLLEPLVEEGHKTLVFSQFVSMLELIEKALQQRGIASLRLTGKTRNRKELIERFQNESEEKVFLLSLKAAGSGLNLTAASYVALFDPWWNPAVEAQAIDRTHRIGQVNQVIAYRILAKDTVEEKIRALQLEKADLARALFGESASDAAVDLDELESILA